MDSFETGDEALTNYGFSSIESRLEEKRHELEEKETEWTVYGSLCTVSDILLKKLVLKDARVGDYLVFHNIGAYSVTEGIYLFLSRKMPAIYLYSEEKGAELVRDQLETWILNMER